MSDVIEAKIVEREQPKRPKLFGILAYNAVRDEWWMLDGDLYEHPVLAEEAAAKQFGEWTHYDIVRIPGN